MKKKGFLLIDRSKNAAILSPYEIKRLPDLYKQLTNRDVLASVRKHKTRAELNKSISEYLSGGWEEYMRGWLGGNLEIVRILEKHYGKIIDDDEIMKESEEEE